jgi:hypothetical protein
MVPVKIPVTGGSRVAVNVPETGEQPELVFTAEYVPDHVVSFPFGTIPLMTIVLPTVMNAGASSVKLPSAPISAGAK